MGVVARTPVAPTDSWRNPNQYIPDCRVADTTDDLNPVVVVSIDPDDAIRVPGYVLLSLYTPTYNVEAVEVVVISSPISETVTRSGTIIGIAYRVANVTGLPAPAMLNVVVVGLASVV